MKLKNLSQTILDLNICALFGMTSMFVMKNILPKGYTTEFFERGYILIGWTLLGLIILFVLSLFFEKKFELRKKFQILDLNDIMLLSLPMSPVITFIILNIEYLNLIGFIYVLIIPFVFCLFFTLILPLLLSYFGSYKMLMISGLAISYTTLNMAQITNNPTTHVFNSQFITQGFYLIGSFIITYILYSFNKRVTYVLLITFMISGVFLNLFSNSSYEDTDKIRSSDRLKLFLDKNINTIIHKKDIYILIFESYSNEETLKYYGYENEKQLDFLRDNNFTVYQGIYSKGSTSLASTSRILELKNNFSRDERHYINGNAFILDALKANGYKTIGLFKSPYAFGSSPIKWDEYYPKDDVTKIGGKTILKAIYEGYFRFDIFDDDYNKDTYLNLRNEYLNVQNKQPTLFYTHGEYPGHSQNSGKCLENEKEKHFQGMKRANNQMKKDIEILKKNNPKAIIVIVGDHGPHLTKNCTVLEKFKKNEINRLDVQDRYGAFLAIHWPEDLKRHSYNIQIIQDIFPAILGNITNNKNLFDELKLDRSSLYDYKERIGGVNVSNGIIVGGEDDKKPLFNNRSYILNK